MLDRLVAAVPERDGARRGEIPPGILPPDRAFARGREGGYARLDNIDVNLIRLIEPAPSDVGARRALCLLDLPLDALLLWLHYLYRQRAQNQLESSLTSFPPQVNSRAR